MVEKMCKVAFLCVQEQPETRPTMSVVVRMLEGEEDIASLSENPYQHMFGSPTDVNRLTSTKREVSPRVEPEDSQ